MEEQPPQFATHVAIDRLNQLLNLPYHSSMQDCDIELADAKRVGEFCDLYETGDLDSDEMFLLMELIVASLDDLLNDEAIENVSAVQRVMFLLRRDFVLHFNTVAYWSSLDETDETNVFAVTPFIRQVWQDCFRPEYASWI